MVGVSVAFFIMLRADRGHRPRFISRPVASHAPAISEFSTLEGTTTSDSGETATCIFQPGVQGMVKVELTCGEKAKLVLKSGHSSNDLSIRAGNTLLLQIPPDGSLSLVAGKHQQVEVHWVFIPRK